MSDLERAQSLARLRRDATRARIDARTARRARRMMRVLDAALRAFSEGILASAKAMTPVDASTIGTIWK